MTTDPHPSRRCPECGRLDAEADGHAAAHRPLPLLLTALAVLTWLAWTIWSPTRVNYVSGNWIGEYVVPGFTPEQIDALAAARTSGDGSLTNSVLSALQPTSMVNPGDDDIRFAYGPIQGARIDYSSYGWPAGVLLTTQIRSYKDPLAREGLIPAVTDPKKRPMGPWEAPSDPQHIPVRPAWQRWGSTIVHTPPPESTGGVVVQRTLILTRLACSLAALAGIWTLLGIIPWIARLRKSDRWHRRGVWVRRTCMILVLAWAAARSTLLPEAGAGGMYEHWSKTTQQGPANAIYLDRSGYLPVGLRESRLLSLSPGPESDRLLASLIAGAGIPAQPGHRLCVWRVCEAQVDGRSTQWGAGLPVISWQTQTATRRADMGDPVQIAMPRGLTITLQHATLAIRFDHADPADGSTGCNINLPDLAAIIGAAWLCWSLLGRIAWLASGRRAAIRRRRGLCVGCAYPLAAPTAPPS